MYNMAVHSNVKKLMAKDNSVYGLCVCVSVSTCIWAGGGEGFGGLNLWFIAEVMVHVYHPVTSSRMYLCVCVCYRLHV